MSSGCHLSTCETCKTHPLSDHQSLLHNLCRADPGRARPKIIKKPNWDCLCHVDFLENFHPHWGITSGSERIRTSERATSTGRHRVEYQEGSARAESLRQGLPPKVSRNSRIPIIPCFHCVTREVTSKRGYVRVGMQMRHLDHS